MQKTVSATDARIHFGEIMRTAQIAPVVVERSGEPLVVILSKQEYERMANTGKDDWREMLAEVHSQIAAELQGRRLPDPAEMIRAAREGRDEQIVGNLP